MNRLRLHSEKDLVSRIGWLRAAVLGANDGIVSTASLIVGVAAAAATRADVLIVGVAGLVAGAVSMAAGEYVSVSSPSDTEKADLDREREELNTHHDFELNEHSRLNHCLYWGTVPRKSSGDLPALGYHFGRRRRVLAEGAHGAP